MNNKGMTTIELIVSFSLTAVVVALLLQLLVSLNRLSGISGIKTELLTKKSNITSAIYKDLESSTVSSILSEDDKITLTLTSGEEKIIQIDDEAKKISYNNKSYKFPQNTSISNLTVENVTPTNINLETDNAFIKINISINYANVKGNYNISVVLPYNYSSEIVYTAAIPTSSYCKTLTYNGQEQVLTKNIGNGYTLSDNIGVDATNYTITATLKDGYKWTDGSTEPKTFDCSINKRKISVTATNQTKTYNGSPLYANTQCSVTKGSLISGHQLSCTAMGLRTDVGSSEKGLNNVAITSAGTDVSSNYEVTKISGLLTVKKGSFKITLDPDNDNELDTTTSNYFWFTSEQSGTATVELYAGKCDATVIYGSSTFQVTGKRPFKITLKGTETLVQECVIKVTVVPTNQNYNTAANINLILGHVTASKSWSFSVSPSSKSNISDESDTFSISINTGVTAKCTLSADTAYVATIVKPNGTGSSTSGSATETSGILGSRSWTVVPKTSPPSYGIPVKIKCTPTSSVYSSIPKIYRVIMLP